MPGRGTRSCRPRPSAASANRQLAKKADLEARCRVARRGLIADEGKHDTSARRGTSPPHVEELTRLVTQRRCAYPQPGRGAWPHPYQHMIGDTHRAHNIRQGYIPMFIAGLSTAKVVGICQRLDDPVWTHVDLTNVEALCGTSPGTTPIRRHFPTSTSRPDSRNTARPLTPATC
ncbi:hypothetical protein GCM10027186_61640 [Micromonospora schwarzwaldensis]